jgi:hypothetical protein
MIALPSASQIDKAKPWLRHAGDLAIMIDAMEGHAPASVVERHRQQFQFNLERAAAALGKQLVPSAAPVSLVIDNTNHAEAGPR